MIIPKNKWLIAAIAWAVASVYALIFREATGQNAPPFPHFDKLAHCLLFFAQFWLCSKIWLSAKRPIPFLWLMILASIWAACTELAQHFFTQTRQGDVWDALADMVGAGVALQIARILQTKKSDKSRINRIV